MYINVSSCLASRSGKWPHCHSRIELLCWAILAWSLLARKSGHWGSSIQCIANLNIWSGSCQLWFTKCCVRHVRKEQFRGKRNLYNKFKFKVVKVVQKLSRVPDQPSIFVTFEAWAGLTDCPAGLLPSRPWSLTAVSQTAKLSRMSKVNPNHHQAWHPQGSSRWPVHECTANVSQLKKHLESCVN